MSKQEAIWTITLSLLLNNAVMVLWLHNLGLHQTLTNLISIVTQNPLMASWRELDEKSDTALTSVDKDTAIRKLAWLSLKARERGNGLIWLFQR